MKINGTEIPFSFWRFSFLTPWQKLKINARWCLASLFFEWGVRLLNGYVTDDVAISLFVFSDTFNKFSERISKS